MPLTAIDAIEVVALFLRDGAAHFERKKLRVSRNRIERCAKLVRHRCEELALRRIRFFCLASGGALTFDELPVSGYVYGSSEREPSSIGQCPKCNTMEVPRVDVALFVHDLAPTEMERF